MTRHVILQCTQYSFVLKTIGYCTLAYCSSIVSFVSFTTSVFGGRDLHRDPYCRAWPIWVLIREDHNVYYSITSCLILKKGISAARYQSLKLTAMSTQWRSKRDFRPILGFSSAFSLHLSESSKTMSKGLLKYKHESDPNPWGSAWVLDTWQDMSYYNAHNTLLFSRQ